MFAIKLTLILAGFILYPLGTVFGLVVGIPKLLSSGETQDIIAALAGFIAWLLISFGLIVHIIKTARPGAGGGR